MIGVSEALDYVFGSTTFLGLIGSIAYYRQTKRTKEAETKLREAEAEKVKLEVEGAKIDVSKSEVNRIHEQVDHQQKTVENLIEVNNNLSKALADANDALIEARARNTELSNRAYKSEQEVNRVQDLVNAKNEEIVKLTKRNEYLESVKCLRADCQDPRGPKPPRKGQRSSKLTCAEKNDNEKTTQ